jgi:hypothetical protein
MLPDNLGTRVISKLHSIGLTDTVTLHGDASYSLHAVDPTSFARPPDPEQAYVAGGIVIVSQAPKWRKLPSLVIQIQNGQDMHIHGQCLPHGATGAGSGIAPYQENGKAQCGHPDCQSAMNLVKQSMREGIPGLHRRSQAHITNTCFHQLPRLDQCKLVKVKAHIERRQRDRSRWSDDEYGNFIADCAADPDWQESIHPANPASPSLLPQGEFLAFDATTILLASMPPATWNLYDSKLCPTLWSFLRRQNEDQRQLHYLTNREHHSAHIQRNRRWTT